MSPLQSVPDLARPAPPRDFEPGESRKAPTWRAAYADRTALILAKMARLAYETDRATLQTRLAEGGFELLGVYDSAVAQAFLAKSPHFAVLAFRGTDSAADWKASLSSVAVNIETSLGAVRVHAGFRAAFAQVEAAIAADLDRYVGRNLGVYITGHSLGGALAQIASATLERDTLAACYSFGSPRVGDLSFDFIVKCPHYRVVNGWDFVTTLPPPLVTPFRHTGDARLLTDLGLAPLRRDRNVFAKLWQNVFGLLFYLAGVRWLFADHYLEAYLEKLEAVLPLKGAARVREWE